MSFCRTLGAPAPLKDSEPLTTTPGGSVAPVTVTPPAPKIVFSVYVPGAICTSSPAPAAPAAAPIEPQAVSPPPQPPPPARHRVGRRTRRRGRREGGDHGGGESEPGARG